MVEPSSTTALVFRLARVLLAADVGAFRLRVALRGLRAPATSLSAPAASLPEATARATAGCAAPAPATAAHRAWGAGGWGSWGYAAAGLLAGLQAFTAVQASCEAGYDGADVAQVRAAALQIWEQLDAELQRLEASLPSSRSLTRLPQPRVSKEGEEVVVEFFVPQELDVGGALLELRRQLRSPSFGSVQEGMSGSAVTEESTGGQAGRSWRLRRRSKGLGDLTVEVEQPRDPNSHAWFSFRAKGHLGERDLRLIAATLHSAIQTSRKAPTDDFAREFGDTLGGMLGDMGGLGGMLGDMGRFFEGLGPFVGQIQEMVREFERMQQGQSAGSGEEEGGGWGERDTEPTPLRRPKRFEDFPGGAPPALGSGRHPALGTLEGAEDAAAREQRRQQARVDAVVKKLQGQGAQVFLPGKKEDIDWGILAGYEAEKRQIEDTVLLALTHPDVYDDIARKTRRHYASNRPRAVLFEGPPGTGKTTSARVIATQAAVPLVYIPLEAIMSKWYGESERQLSEMLKACESFPDGCIIFLDELDSLATSRSTDMHEATRRLLGVLLRHLDGFDASKRTVVIGATNRKQDLDPALISRFSATVTFELPTDECRVKILRQYAQHLTDAELLALARATLGMAGRDMRDVAEQAERHWASKIIRGKAPKGKLPPLQEYLDAAQQRLREMGGRNPLDFV